MITVSELFRRLSYGPLSNIAISNEGAGGIAEAKQPAIIQYANEGLLRLHSRFVLIERELIIELIDGVTSYPIDSTYAFSKSTGDASVPAYIQDSTVVPYQDDLIKIMAVFNCAGCQLPLNNDGDCCSFFTPQPNVLQVPNPLDEATIHLTYQARHKKLSDYPAVLTEEINIPFVLEEALLSYIASSVYSNMNGQEHGLKAAAHLSKFESICNDVRAQDLVNSSISGSLSKFCERGFV